MDGELLLVCRRLIDARKPQNPIAQSECTEERKEKGTFETARVVGLVPHVMSVARARAT